MKYAKITIEVELPDDYDEGEIDTAIADSIAEKGGHVLDSKEYIELELDEVENY